MTPHEEFAKGVRFVLKRLCEEMIPRGPIIDSLRALAVAFARQYSLMNCKHTVSCCYGRGGPCIMDFLRECGLEEKP